MTSLPPPLLFATLALLLLRPAEAAPPQGICIDVVAQAALTGVSDRPPHSHPTLHSMYKGAWGGPSHIVKDNDLHNACLHLNAGADVNEKDK